MNLKVKNLVLSYETLANKAVQLNSSYLSLLKVYEQLNLDSSLLLELEKKANSPKKVISSMQRDQQRILEEFTKLASSIANAQLDFTSNPEAEQLSAIAHDCEIMKEFISSIDLADLQKMFNKLSN